MNNCPSCGKDLKSDYSFCPACGYDLRQADTEAENLPQAEGFQMTEAPENSSMEDVQASGNKVVLALCDVCGEETGIDTGYCNSCGAKLSGDEEKVTRTIAPGKLEAKAAASDNRPEQSIRKVQEPKKASDLRSREVRNKPSAVKENLRKENKTGKGSRPGGMKGRTQSGTKSVSTVNIVVLIVAVLALGLVVLEIAGVFDTKPAVTAGNQVQQQNQAGSPQISLEALEQINSLEASVKQDTTNLTSVLQLAHTLNDAGFFERAINYYRMYLRANPRNADVQVDMGVCYYELKKFDMAKSVMRKGLSIDPRHQIGHFNLGIVNLSAGNADSAKIWWQKAVELNPNSDIGKKAKELLETH